MISLVGSLALFARQLIGFIGLGIKCLISLVRLNGHISLINLGDISLVSFMGLIGSHISHGLGLIGLIGLLACEGGLVVVCEETLFSR